MHSRKMNFAAELGLYMGVAISVFAGRLLLYGSGFPLHHDLAGSVLSGRLEVTLGDVFRDYSLYFPPSEKFWFSAAAHLSDVFGIRLHLVIVMMTGAVVLSGAGLAYWIRLKAVGALPETIALDGGVAEVSEKGLTSRLKRSSKQPD